MTGQERTEGHSGWGAEPASADATGSDEWGPSAESESDAAHGTVWVPRDQLAGHTTEPAQPTSPAQPGVRPGRWGTVVGDDADHVRAGNWGTVISPTEAPPKPVLPQPRSTEPDSEATPARIRPGADRYAAPVDDAPAAPVPVRQAYRMPIIIGAAAVAVILVVAAVLFFTRPQTDKRLITASTSSSAVAKVGKPEDVVKSYFQALQNGTAAQLLEFGDPGPGSRALLTDEVLQAARTAQPVTEVTVSPTDPGATTVGVDYKIGGQKVSQQIPVIKKGDGWLLDHTTVSVAITGKRSDKVPLEVNGVRTDSALVEVFPGGYSVTTGLPFIAYDDAVSFKVRGLDAKPTIPQLTTKITPAGTAALQDAAKRSLNACLARKELAPANCPFAVRSNQDVVPSSISRKLDNDPFANFGPLLEPASSFASAVVEVRTTVNATTSGGSTISDPKQNSATLRADLSVDKPEKINVNWTL